MSAQHTARRRRAAAKKAAAKRAALKHARDLWGFDASHPSCPACGRAAHVHKGWWTCTNDNCTRVGQPIREIRPDENPDPQGRPA
jgi:NADH pyrophosphatase NudC (nudix superfamily)